MTSASPKIIYSTEGILVKQVIAFFVGACMLLALGAVVRLSVAQAHAEISSCTPEMNSTVETAPDKVVCKTSEAMNPDGSSLSVFDASGMQVDKKDSAVDLNDADRVTISVSLDTAMVKDGVYTVKWKTVSAADGDDASGEFKFTVGHGMDMGSMDQTTTPEAMGQDDGADHSMAQAMIDGKQVMLKILAPLDNATLPAGDVKVEAQVDGMTLGENGTHLHFYVDGNLALMGEGAQTSTTLNLEPGRHELRVDLATSEHMDALSTHVHVNVEAAGQAQATATAAPTQAMSSATATAVPTETAAAPTPAPTQAAPATTLPSTGGDMNNVGLGLLVLFGLLCVGGGALVVARARR